MGGIIEGDAEGGYAKRTREQLTTKHCGNLPESLLR